MKASMTFWAESLADGMNVGGRTKINKLVARCAKAWEPMAWVVSTVGVFVMIVIGCALEDAKIIAVSAMAVIAAWVPAMADSMVNTDTSKL